MRSLGDLVISPVGRYFRLALASYTTVHPISSMRFAAPLLLLGGGLAFAQGSQLPATQPTSGTLPASAPASSPAPAAPATHRAEVTYSANQLQVTANNSSLNEILHQISRVTGIKITGGVVDERVYGKYGPAPLDRVLASLLDGTGSNMILRQTPQNTPGELILTPRNGGPTPPNPNAAKYDDEPAPTPPPVVKVNSGVIANPVATPPAPQPSAPVEVVNSPVAAPATEPPPTTPAPQPAGTGDTTPATNNTPSPNGVKTPQQIYQELQQLQQQQRQPPQPANPH